MRIAGFLGIAPRFTRRMLGDRQAQVATNCVLTGGDVRPTNSPSPVTATLVDGALSIFRMVSGGTDYWLSWDRDVDVARGPIAGDTQQRIYWTGDGEPRCSDFATACAGQGPYPAGAFVLGVFAPDTAPSVAYSGTEGEKVSRAFVYTFVNAWGEESAPSPASSVVTGGNSSDGQWDLTDLRTKPENTFTASTASWTDGVATFGGITSTFGLRVGEEVSVSGVLPAGYNVARAKIVELTATTIGVAMEEDPGSYSSGGTIARIAAHNNATWKQRFYWTETTPTGTEYHFVGEQVAASTAAIAGDALSGELLPSAEWAMPPTDMHSVGILPNGIMFGASKNELCLSEPNKPYAWPTRYRQPADFRVVGAGSVGTTIVVATEGTPYTLAGVDPATMGGGMAKVEQMWPCTSKRSIASLGFGIAFAAPQGLALIGPQGAEIVTRDLATQREWAALRPETFVAAVMDGRYHFSYSPEDGRSYVLTIDKTEPASMYDANYAVDELWTDPLSGQMYMLREGQLEAWEGDVGQRDLFDWWSKEFVLPRPVNLGAAKIDADFTMTEAESVAAGQAGYQVVAANQDLIDDGQTFGAIGENILGVLPIGGDEMGDVPNSSFEALQFILYVDNRLKYSRQIHNSAAFKLPAGYKTDNFSVRVSGNVAVNAIVLAESMDGLRRS